MARDQIDMRPIETRDELVAWLAEGCKPKSQFRIGTEHEKLPSPPAANPIPYDQPRGIRTLLEGMKLLLGWEPIMEEGNIIGLYDVTGGGAISLEPGGQFELSGAPVETVHQMCRVRAHLAQVHQVAQPLGIGFLGVGMAPKWSRADMPMMPKGRYRIMTAYMPKVGKFGLDMMPDLHGTDQSRLFLEPDMVKKLRVSLALQPVGTALFANSPFTEGKPNGFLSFRSEIWRDTDPARSGMLPWAFEPGMGFERWVDYALDVPMYFVKRGERYIDVAGQSFRDLMAGKLPALPGEHATISGWANHLDDFSGGAAQALSGDARLRPARSDGCRRCLPTGRHSLRRRLSRCRLGCGETLDGGGTAEAARRRAEARLQSRNPWRHGT